MSKVIQFFGNSFRSILVFITLIYVESCARIQISNVYLISDVNKMKSMIWKKGVKEKNCSHRAERAKWCEGI